MRRRVIIGFIVILIATGGLAVADLIGGNSDLRTVISSFNQNLLEQKGRQSTEIFKDNTGTRRVLLGKGANGFYGLKVSQEGNDVYTAADSELIFNSNQNMFKINNAVEVDYTYSFPAHAPTASGTDTATFTYTHNLGYTPVYTSYYLNSSNQFVQMPYHSVLNIGAGSNENVSHLDFRAHATTTTIVFTLEQRWATTSGTIPAISGSGVIKLYILQESLES